MKTAIFLLGILFFLKIHVSAQSIAVLQRDTLYYLIDTAKTVKSDRIFSIDHYPRTIQYSVFCPCVPENNSFSFHYYTIKGLPDTSLKQNIYVSKRELKKIKFIRLYKLIDIVCKERTRTNLNHVFKFVEHLPNGKYVSREVALDSFLDSAK